MNVTVFGTGYVGLVQGAVLADIGNQVLCIDTDADKVGRLTNGEVPIHEPGLEGLVRSTVADGRLAFSGDARRGVEHGEVIFIAVGTPPAEDGCADLSHVLAVAETIGTYLSDYRLIATKSTVPVGTAERIAATIRAQLARRGIDCPFDVVANPEFLKEGAAVSDCQRPDRIIIGTDSGDALATLRELYAPLNRSHERIIQMDARSAELTKYASNAMLATRISFINELALLADEVGADIELVRQGMGSDPRIGYHFLYAGAGYGGSCFPKDVRALIRCAAENGHRLQVLRAVEAANEAQKRVLVDKVVGRFGEHLAGRHFAMWGLAFKPDTDDIREAPSRVIIAELLTRGATVCAYDPAAMTVARCVFEGESRLSFADSPMAALDGADALLIVTEWKAFRSPDFDAVRRYTPVIFDGRNMYTPALPRAAGIEYFPIGRC
jgi:UDPglucose 6-dehydrogenase